MLSKEEALQVVTLAVEKSDADETEVLLFASDSALTRYAGNAITQNTSAHTIDLSVRALVGDRVGRASTNRMDPASIEQTVARALEAARQAHDDPQVAHLIAGPLTYAPVDAHDADTAALSAQAKADAIAYVCGEAKQNQIEASGTFSNDATAVALANSRGIQSYYASTQADFAATVASDDSSGWAQATHRRVGDIDPKRVADTAVEKATASRNPKAIEPGAYTVILEPAAATDFLLFMTRSFGAKTVAEGRSFLSGKVGEPVLGSNITLADDAYHPDTGGMPFDFEGTPKQRVPLIEAGVSKGLVYDTKTAQEAGRDSTGHGMPQPSPEGPFPMNLVMAGGDSSLEEMIASTERGILVTHFHYTNVIDPIRLVLTGMTRDGTFWVEGGRIRHAVRNLRFTESAVEALNRVEALSAETIFASSFFGGGFIVPAMKINNFTFSSATEF